MNKILLFSVNIILALFTFSCAFMDRLAGIPPKSKIVPVTQAWPHVRRVAILLDDREFNHSLTTGLLGRVSWEIVTRQHLERVIREQNFQLSGYVDSRTAVEFGKLAGVDAIFTGNLSTERGETEYGTRYRATCDIQLIDCQTGSILYSGTWWTHGGTHSEAIRSLGFYVARHFKQ